MLISGLISLPWFEFVTFFIATYTFVKVKETLDAMIQGNSPNKFFQAINHILLGFCGSALFTTLFPTGMPLVSQSMVTFLTGVLPASFYLLEAASKRMSSENPRLGSLLQTFAIKAQKAHLFIAHLSLIPMACLYFFGLAPVTALLGIVLGFGLSVIDSHGLVPSKYLDKFHRYVLYPASVIYSFHISFLFGLLNSLEALTALFKAVDDYVDKAFEKILSFSISCLEKIKPGSALIKWLKENKKRLFPLKPPTFKYNGPADSFYADIKGLACDPRLRVNKLHVRQLENEMPPARENIHDQDILNALDSIDWTKHHERLKKEIEADWSTHGIDTDDPQTCSNLLREGVVTYLDAIRHNKMPNTTGGTGELTNRYLDNIIYLLNEHQSNQQIVISSLIKIGIEGGKSCPNGKIRILEETYRGLISENHAGSSPEFRIASLLQTDRELYFRQAVETLKSVNFAFKFMNHFFSEQDTHYDNLLISLLAPNLGLPQLSAATESGNNKTKIESIFYSLISIIEPEFWRMCTPEYLLATCQAGWFGKMCFASEDYTHWLQDFIDHKLDDTQKAKEDLKEDYSHYPLPDQGLDEDLLTLMLLDMGVLYLKGGNELGEKTQEQTLNEYTGITSHFNLRKRTHRNQASSQEPIPKTSNRFSGKPNKNH